MHFQQVLAPQQSSTLQYGQGGTWYIDLAYDHKRGYIPKLLCKNAKTWLRKVTEKLGDTLPRIAAEYTAAEAPTRPFVVTRP